MKLRCPYHWSSSWHWRPLSSVAKWWHQNMLAFFGAFTPGKCQSINRLCSLLYCGRGSTVANINCASSWLGFYRLFKHKKPGPYTFQTTLPNWEDFNWSEGKVTRPGRPFYPYNKESETLNWAGLYIAVLRCLKWIVLFWRKWVEWYIRDPR